MNGNKVLWQGLEPYYDERRVLVVFEDLSWARGPGPWTPRPLMARNATVIDKARRAVELGILRADEVPQPEFAPRNYLPTGGTKEEVEALLEKARLSLTWDEALPGARGPTQGWRASLPEAWFIVRDGRQSRARFCVQDGEGRWMWEGSLKDALFGHPVGVEQLVAAGAPDELIDRAVGEEAKEEGRKAASLQSQLEEERARLRAFFGR